MDCLHCHMGVMQQPPDNHPSYVVCNNCGAIELTYRPQDYQEPLHTVPYVELEKEFDGVTYKEIQMQIVGAFGGKNP